MNKEQILGFIRHALTLAGGVLITNGMIDEETLIEAVGAAVTLISFTWSLVSKRKAKEETPE